MVEYEKKANVTKVYCEKCDIVFDSKQEYERHCERYCERSSSVVCESCPIDTVISKFLGFFKKNNE